MKALLKILFLLLVVNVSVFSQKLEIKNGATLTANSVTIRVAGHWYNNGIFNAGSSTIIFNGDSETQYLNPQTW